jgi:hypothetical protein
MQRTRFTTYGSSRLLGALQYASNRRAKTAIEYIEHAPQRSPKQCRTAGPRRLRRPHHSHRDGQPSQRQAGDHPSGHPQRPGGAHRRTLGDQHAFHAAQPGRGPAQGAEVEAQVAAYADANGSLCSSRYVPSCMNAAITEEEIARALRKLTERRRACTSAGPPACCGSIGWPMRPSNCGMTGPSPTASSSRCPVAAPAAAAAHFKTKMNSFWPAALRPAPAAPPARQLDATSACPSIQEIAAAIDSGT